MELTRFKDYVLHADSGFEVPVNMFEEISNFKRLHNKSPVIIINLTCLPIYAQHNEETVFGGRHDIYRKTIDDFFIKLRSAGAILEFCTIVVTESKSLFKKKKKYEEMTFILEQIYKGTSVKETLELNGNSLHLGLMKNNLPSIARKHGGIFKAMSYESLNYKMAEKARKLNAFAIISDTTQLWFFDVPFKFWYGRNVNFQDGTTTVLNRESLLNSLGLKQNHLPLLGTLMGADNNLKNKHFSLRFGVGFKNKLKGIVDFILKFPEILNRIEIHKVSRLSVLPYVQNLFAASYDYFTLNREWNEPQGIIERFLYFENTVDNFLIVGGYPSYYDVSFFDHKQNDFDRFVDLRILLLQRKAGILLQHKKDSTLKHYYFSRKVHLGDMERSSFVPVYPQITVPCLNELLCPSDYPELNEIRYYLLCWAIDENIQKSTILNFNPKYIVDILALYSGLKHEFIKPFEAMVILMTIYTVITDRIPEQMTYPTHVNERAMRLAFVYSSLHNQITDIVRAVGLDLIDTTERFDGVFFHILYNVWMNYSIEELNMVFEGYPVLKEILAFFV